MKKILHTAFIEAIWGRILWTVISLIGLFVFGKASGAQAYLKFVGAVGEFLIPGSREQECGTDGGCISVLSNQGMINLFFFGLFFQFVLVSLIYFGVKRLTGRRKPGAGRQRDAT